MHITKKVYVSTLAGPCTKHKQHRFVGYSLSSVTFPIKCPTSAHWAPTCWAISVTSPLAHRIEVESPSQHIRLCLFNRNLLREETKIPLILVTQGVWKLRFPASWIQVRPSLGTAKLWLYAGDTLLQISQKRPGLLIQPLLVQLQWHLWTPCCYKGKSP